MLRCSREAPTRFRWLMARWVGSPSSRIRNGWRCSKRSDRSFPSRSTGACGRRASTGRDSPVRFGSLCVLKEDPVANLIYSAITSLDGYVADEDGNFDWAAPDEDIHTFVNQLERPVGTYLYGRRMYEVMAFWEDANALADQPPFVREFGEIWRATDKVVF